MSRLKSRLYNLSENVALAIKAYPVAILCAVALSIATSFQIEGAFESGANLTKLILSLLFGTAFNMALSVALQRFKPQKHIYWLVNGAGLFAAAVLFLLLLSLKDDVSSIASARIWAAIFISLIAFLLIPSVKSKTDVNIILFLMLKCLFIAFIYFLVMISGIFLIFFAIKALIFEDLSFTFIEHAAVYSTLVAFIFFIGSLPVFSGENENNIKRATAQPKFIQILLRFIVIPLMSALSVVLLMWAALKLTGESLPPFEQVTAIISSYCLIGILIYMLVSHYEDNIAKLYRRIFPIAALVFLAFKAYAIVVELAEKSLFGYSYFVILLWIFAVFTCIVFIVKPVYKNWLSPFIAALLIVINVLPIVGSMDLPPIAQQNRLKNLLEQNNILQNGTVTPNPDIDNETKEKISEAYYYLSNLNRLPDWAKSSGIAEMLGYEPSYPTKEYKNYTLRLKDTNIDVSDYDYYLYSNEKYDEANKFTIDNCTIYYYRDDDKVKIQQGGNLIYEESLTDFFEKLYEEYKEGTNYNELPVDKISFDIENEHIKVKIIFESINILIFDNCNYDEYIYGVLYSEKT